MTGVVSLRMNCMLIAFVPLPGCGEPALTPFIGTCRPILELRSRPAAGHRGANGCRHEHHPRNEVEPEEEEIRRDRRSQKRRRKQGQGGNEGQEAPPP